MLVFQYLAAAAVGCAIGLAFGLVQDLAAKRYLRRQREGAAQTPWSVLPGSGRRVAALLVILAFVQVFGSMLFSNGIGMVRFKRRGSRLRHQPLSSASAAVEGGILMGAAITQSQT